MSKAATDRSNIQSVRKKLALGFGLPILGSVVLVALMVWLLDFVRDEEKHANGVMLTINAAWVKTDLEAKIARNALALPSIANDIEYSQLDRSSSLGMKSVNNITPGLVLVFSGAGLATHVSFSPTLGSESVDLIRKTISKQVEERLLLGRGGVLGPFKLDKASDNGYIAIVNVSDESESVYVGILDLSELLRASLPLSVTENMDVYITQANFAAKEFNINNPAMQYGNSLPRVRGNSGPRVNRPYQYVSDLELDGLTLQLRFYGTHKGYQPSLNIWLNISAMLIFCSILLNLFLLWRDSRRRLEVEAKLREEKLFRESMQDSMAVGLRVWDLNGIIRYVNPAFCNMVGYTPSELIGVPQPLPYWPSKSEEQYKKIVRDVIAGLAPTEGFETVYQHKNGQLIDVLIVEAPLKDGKGEHTGWMSSVIDITDRKRSEALIEQQREKLEAASRFALVGEMASNIAHELNQPLATMVSFAQAGLNLTDKGASLDKYAQLFQKLRDQAQRAGKVVGTVQNLVRKRKPMRESIAVDDLIESIRFMVTATAMQHDVRLHFKIEAPATQLHVDRIMVEQAVVNLVKNASEAFTAAQRIRNVWIGARPTPEGFEFSVRDDGPGLSLNNTEKMFEALVSTKPDGLGLGLSLCRSVAEAHGGRLKAEPVPTGGTCFTMDLPMAVIKEPMEGEHLGAH